jgi:uncharacterized protein
MPRSTPPGHGRRSETCGRFVPRSQTFSKREANEPLCIKRKECDKLQAMINPQSPVRIQRAQILRIAAQNGVKRLRVFGSVARGTEDEQSDIDFLVELAADRRLLDLGNFLYEVRSLLGKEVDVVTEKGLQRRIRERVLAEAVDLWETTANG